MLNLSALISNSRRVAIVGAFTIGAIAFSGPASATPVQLFPFFPAPPMQFAPPPAVEAAPSDDEGVVRELPARLERQIVQQSSVGRSEWIGSTTSAEHQLAHGLILVHERQAQRLTSRRPNRGHVRQLATLFDTDGRVRQLERAGDRFDNGRQYRRRIRGRIQAPPQIGHDRIRLVALTV